jgi:microcystin-dependent protein
MSITLTTDSKELLVNKKYISPVGSIICYAGIVKPDGWLFCDGSEVSRFTYPDLYATILSTYGGTPTSPDKFFLPNLNERMPVGKSTTSGFSLGNHGGSKTVDINSNNLPPHSHTGTTLSDGSHTHTATDSGHTHTYSDAYFAENMEETGNNKYGTSSGTDWDNNFIYRTGPVTTTGYANITVANNGAHTHTFTTNNSTGTGAPINVQNPYIALNYLIKY